MNCSGSGAKDQSNIITCNTCKGSGQVKRVQKTIFGQFAQSGICSDCSGTGKTVKERCSVCSGKGAELEKKDIAVQIPRGVSSGDTIKLSGEGEFGGIGSVKGDIFIRVNVPDHEYFSRRGKDVLLTLELDVTQAILGDNLEVPTLDGFQKVSIPSGTQNGDIIQIKGKGFTDIGGSSRGNQINVIKVAIPKDLSSEEKDKIIEFKNLSENSDKKKSKGIFRKFMSGS